MLRVEVYLETDRLLLRKLTDADVENLFLLDSDPAVMRFINGGKATPRDVIETETLPQAGLTYVRTFHESWPEPIEGTSEGDVECVLTRSAWAARAARKR